MPKGEWAQIAHVPEVISIAANPRISKPDLWFVQQGGTIGYIRDPYSEGAAYTSLEFPANLRIVTTGPWEWVWAVDKWNFVWRYDREQWLWTSPHNALAGRSISDIAVTDTEVRLVDEIGAQYVSEDWGKTYKSATSWLPISRLSYGGSGILWSLMKGTGWITVWRSNPTEPLGGHWERPSLDPQGYVAVAVSPAGAWLVDEAGQVSLTLDEGLTLGDLESYSSVSASAIACGASVDSLWVADNNGFIYKWTPEKIGYCAFVRKQNDYTSLGSQIHPTAFGISATERRSTHDKIFYKVLGENLVLNTTPSPPPGHS